MPEPGKYILNAVGQAFIGRQRWLLRFSLPVSALIFTGLTAALIFNTGLTIKGVFIWIGGNSLNYFLNLEYNYFRRLRTLATLVVSAEFSDDQFTVITYSGQVADSRPDALELDNSKLFAEYDECLPRYIIGSGRRQIIYIPAFLSTAIQ